MSRASPLVLLVSTLALSGLLGFRTRVARAQNQLLPAAHQQTPAKSEEEAPPADTQRVPRSHAKLAAFFQLGGSAGIAGFGAEYRPVAMLGLHAGLSAFILSFGAEIGGFLGASAIVGRRSHKLEVGLDYMHFVDDYDARFLSPLVGYRYQPERGGVFFRIHAQALARASLDGDVFPTAGLSLGYTK